MSQGKNNSKVKTGKASPFGKGNSKVKVATKAKPLPVKMPGGGMC